MSATLHRYKATVILDTRGREETTDALVEVVKQEMTAAGAQVTASSVIGQFNFARVTDRKLTGSTYLSFEFEGAPGLPVALRERFKLNKLVYRLLLERVD